MKKLFSCLLVLALALSMLSFGVAEETKEYRDEQYAFSYPSTWSCDKASNGDIVLAAPDGKNAVLTFAMISDLLSFTGDAETDGPKAEGYISSYSGKNLALTGEYEWVQSGELLGFRATGSWRATGQDAVMLILTGSRHIVGFILVGEKALALEQGFLDSVVLLGETPEESGEGMLRWENAKFSVDYPKNYGLMEQSTGVAFINPENANCMILARAYDLDADYSDDLAPQIAAARLPKSTKIEPNAEMVTLGGKNAAVIKGTASAGPVEFYVIGSGRTALGLLFLGEDACGYAEAVLASAEIK